jgi:hypothetical protein
MKRGVKMKKQFRFLFIVAALVAMLVSACGGTLPAGTSAGSDKPLASLVEFTGVIEAMDGNQWTINGQTITVDPTVLRDGPYTVGDTVKVEAEVQADGSVVVTRVEAPALPTDAPTDVPTDINANVNANSNDNTNTIDSSLDNANLNSNDNTNSGSIGDSNSNGDDSNDDEGNSNSDSLNENSNGDDDSQDDNSNDSHGDDEDDDDGGNSNSNING